MRPWRTSTDLPRGAPWIGPLVLISLLLVWAVHDGGYDQDTWYWGALVLLAVLTARSTVTAAEHRTLSRGLALALGALSLYGGFSYLSILWAGSPGEALTGSNRVVLYLLVFAVATSVAWNLRRRLIVLCAYSLGVGVLATVILIRLAVGEHVESIVVAGRINAPTGYFNSSVALFTAASGTALVLATVRRLPTVLRATLLTSACACLQMAIAGQSRGWLFTLPFVVVAIVLVARDRLRLAAHAVPVIACALAPLHRLLALYDAAPGAALQHAAARAGAGSLICCGGLLVGTILVIEGYARVPPARLPRALGRRGLGLALIVLLLAGIASGGFLATSGHPFRFLRRQWNGFSHPVTSAATTGSHFSTLGSGRYDFWRVSLDAFAAHPIGGLGQDNFAEYYITRRQTDRGAELDAQPRDAAPGSHGLGRHRAVRRLPDRSARRWPRCMPAARVRSRHIAVAALVPMVVWLAHGSVDWFWEIPALTGPALAFTALAARPGRVSRRLAGASASRGCRSVAAPPRPHRRPASPRCWPLPPSRLPLPVGPAGLPRPDEQAANPGVRSADLDTRRCAEPAERRPDRLAGTIALRVGLPNVAATRFRPCDRPRPGRMVWLVRSRPRRVGTGRCRDCPAGPRARGAHQFPSARGPRCAQTGIEYASALTGAGISPAGGGELIRARILCEFRPKGYTPDLGTRIAPGPHGRERPTCR